MLRNIDIPGAKEVFAKQEELMSTFWLNRGYIKAAVALHDVIRDEVFFGKMQEMRRANIRKNTRSWVEDAAEYYAKHGTVGEF